MNISIQHITMEYPGGTRALDDINVEIGNGMFGLLGPNGAGKSTLMRILTTLMKQTSGTITMDGLDISKNRGQIRAMLGYLPQDFTMFTKLKTWEFLDYAARLAGIANARERKEAVEKMLESVGLYEARERQANKLSGGMKRRLGIAQALIGSPKVVVVDEPTTGLDPEERLRFRNLLADMSSREEIIIILSTHIVGDISSTCRNMAMLERGKVVFNESPDHLIDMARGHAWRIKAEDNQLDAIKSTYPVIATIPADMGWEVEVVGDTLEGWEGTEIDPDLEHAYVYFHEILVAPDQAILT